MLESAKHEKKNEMNFFKLTIIRPPIFSFIKLNFVFIISKSQEFLNKFAFTANEWQLITNVRNSLINLRHRENYVKCTRGKYDKHDRLLN